MNFIEMPPSAAYLILIANLWIAIAWGSHNAAKESKAPWKHIRGATILGTLFLVFVWLTNPFYSLTNMRELNLIDQMIYLTKVFFVITPAVTALGLTIGAVSKLRTSTEPAQ